jgi:hypothetical protein
MKCSEGLSNIASNIIRRYIDHMMFDDYMPLSFIISFLFFRLHHYTVYVLVYMYGCIFCTLLFNCVNNVFLLYLYTIILCMFRSVYSVSLCCSVYCLCVKVCCTLLYCIVLYCTVLYCNLLYCTLLYFTVLYCTVLYCTILYCTVPYCTVLYCIAL